MDWNRKTKIIFSPRKTLRKKRYHVIGALTLGGIMLGVALYGVFWFFHLEKFHIRHIDIVGVRLINADNMKATIMAYMGEGVGVFLPRWNYFLFPTNFMAQKIVDSTPRIKSVNITKAFPDGIRVTIDERIPWGVVCSGDPMIEIQGTEKLAASAVCGYIDDGGIAFERAPTLFGSLTKKIFIGLQTIPFGMEAVSEDYIHAYDLFRDEFSSLSLPMVALSFNAENPRDMRIYVGSWYVLVDRDSSAKEITKILKPLMERELVGKTSRLEYIDLRFGNKVFYRLKK